MSTTLCILIMLLIRLIVHKHDLFVDDNAAGQENDQTHKLHVD